MMTVCGARLKLLDPLPLELLIGPAPDVVAALTFTLFPEQRKIVDRAIKHVSAQLEGKNVPGRALEFICADYLAGADLEAAHGRRSDQA